MLFQISALKLVYPLFFSACLSELWTLTSTIREKNAENWNFSLQLITNLYFDRQDSSPLSSSISSSETLKCLTRLLIKLFFQP